VVVTWVNLHMSGGWHMAADALGGGRTLRVEAVFGCVVLGGLMALGADAIAFGA
jgi:hypothetical protein